MKSKFLKLKIECLTLNRDANTLGLECDHCSLPNFEYIQYLQNKLYAIKYRIQILENKFLDYQFENFIAKF